MPGQNGRVYADRVTLGPPPESLVDITNPVSTVNFFAWPGNPNGELDANVGDRCWQINSANKWRCTGGTAWTLDDGGGGGGGSRWQVTWTPGATTDETIGLYGTWTEAYIAADTIRNAGLDVDIIIGSGGTDPYEIPAGTYDMDGIALIGYPAYEPLSVISLIVNTAAAGVGFDNFTRGISYMTLRHDGADPLSEITADTVEVDLGHHCTWRSTAGVLWDVVGGAGRFTLGTRVSLGAAEDPGVALINVESGASAILYGTTHDVIRDVTSGAGQVSIVQGSGSVTVADQTILTGPFSLTPAATLPVEIGIVLRPSAPDPGNGVYGTWQEAYDAATNLSGKNITIWIDNPGGAGSALVIPAGTFNMQRITLRGYTMVTTAALTPTHWIQTSTGTVFQNFVNGTYDLGIAHAGTAALCTLTVAAAGLTVQVGARSLWIPATNEILRLNGTGACTLYMGARMVWQNGGTDYETLNINAAGVTATISIEGGDGAGPKQDTIRGVGGSTLNISGVFAFETQANFAGTLALASFPVSNHYTPGTPADWTGGATNGFTVQDALDRLASAVEGLLGAPIP